MERRSIFDELGHATWSLDLAVAGLFWVLSTMASLGYGAVDDRLVRSTALGLVMALGLVLRRRKPLTTLTVVTLCCLLHVALVRVPTPQLAAVLLVSYSVARWVSGHRARVVLLLGALGAVLGPARWLQQPPQLDDQGWTVGPGPFPWADAILVGITLFGLVVSMYAVGRRVRESAEASRARTLAQAERRALELAEREQAARAVEVSVRSQIARELHDVVAHSLSVMIVQAEGGRALAVRKPEQAAQVLDTIAETGREALTEMRRIVGVLRAPTEQAALYSPNPGLEGIGDMVARSGERVRLEVSGTPPTVPSTLGLTVYRVVQEAVTNFLKHAGPQARCTVRLSYTPALVVAEISDDGLGSSSASDGRGHGLRGMRERVAAMNGQLVAQPRSEGGYLVRAVLPVPTRDQEM